MRALLLLLLLAAWCPSSAEAATLRVPANYPTIQAAIHASAGSLDTILVSPGTYVENLNTLGKAVTLLSEAGPAGTIIDGSNPVNPDTASVIFASAAITVEGFTITGGTGTLHGLSLDVSAGGAFYLLGRATIRGNWITENHVPRPGSSLLGAGGAILIDTTLPVRIIGNRIFSNSAAGGSRGGAIFNRSGWDVRIEDSVLYDNHAHDGIGGAMYDGPPNAVHLRSLYACNTSDDGASAIYGCGEVRNCTIVGNEGAGAALEAAFGRTHNSIYAFNTGGGLQCGPFASTCNDLYGNTPFDIQGSCLIIGQNGNVSVDPAFGDADSCDASYCLSLESPLLPENSPPGCELIGARSACEVLAVDLLTSPDFVAGPLVARPNPLNPRTTLTFVLEESRHVELKILDAGGRVVRNLMNQTLSRGQHEVTWDGCNERGMEVASGAYVAVLKSPSARLAQKLLVLK